MLRPVELHHSDGDVTPRQKSMPLGAQSFSGKDPVQFVYDKRVGWYIRKKPNGGNHVVTPKRLQARADFTQAIELAKYAPGEMVQAAIEQTKNTGWLPRDILIAAAHGTLLSATTNTGKTILSRRLALSEIETMLRTISTTNGAILVYSQALQQWVALVPGSDAQVLTLVDGLPEWQTLAIPPNTPDAVLDQLDPVLGSMVINDGTNWVQLAPGTPSDYLGIDATTGLPTWLALPAPPAQNSIDMYSPPSASTFSTIINGGGDTPGPSATDTDYGLLLSSGKVVFATTHKKLFLKAPINSTTWSLSMGQWRQSLTWSGSSSVQGLVAYDGTNWIGWGGYGGDGRIGAFHGASLTAQTVYQSFSASQQDATYLRLRRDSSNFYFEASGDGRNWSLQLTEAASSIGTVTGIGFMTDTYLGVSGSAYTAPNTLLVPWYDEQ